MGESVVRLATGAGPTRRPMVIVRLRAGVREACAIIRRERAVHLVVGLHAIVAVVLLVATGQENGLAFSTYLTIWPLAFFAVFPAIYGLSATMIIVHRFDRRRALAWKSVMTPERIGSLAAGAMMLFALMVLQGAFTSIKNALPGWWGSFPFDQTQADIDRWLHRGTDPWLLLHALSEHPALRALIEWNYDQGWFVLCYGTLFLVAVSPSARNIRARYFLTYAVTWIVIGNLLAGLFLSAGPAFYSHVTGDEARFAALHAFLDQSASLQHSAARLQEYLWSLHRAGEAGIGSGISAFPSMHVALVTLNALFLAERGWRWGVAGFAYVALILASSIYLGWHYAIDGYVSITVTIMLHALLRRVMVPATASSAPPAPPDDRRPCEG